MPNRPHYCQSLLVPSPSRTAKVWRIFCNLCLIIVCMTQQMGYAQEIDTLRKGVVKVISTANRIQKTGTGFIIKHDSQVTYILTAAHVVEGDKYPKVAFFSQPHSSIEAEVLQNDTGNDISLLKVGDHKQVPSEVSALPFATSEGVKDNEELIAIGFPAGGGSWATVRVTLAGRHGAHLILDGNINEGNSGGPVLKKNGEIAGLITVKTADSFGRAIPAKLIGMVLEGWGVSVTGSGTIATRTTTAPPPRKDSHASTSNTTKPSTESRLPFEPEMELVLPADTINFIPIKYSFEISKNKITFDEYDVFANATRRKLPDDNGQGRGSRPVINVSFEDAQAYVQWLSQQTHKKYRLLTQAEWEHARNFFFSNGFLDRLSGDGLIGEWVQDCWRNFQETVRQFRNAETDADCTHRVVMGRDDHDIFFSKQQIEERQHPNIRSKSYDLSFSIARDL